MSPRYVLLCLIVALTPCGCCFLPGLLGSPCAGQALPPSSELEFAPGEIVVGFIEGTTQAQAESLVSLFGCYGVTTRKLNQPDYGLWGTVQVPVGEERCWAEVFSNLPPVRYAEPNYIGTTH
jgi:hypothetical protein